MEWTRAGLTAEGFEGFCRFSDLRDASVPQMSGVYVVLRESDGPPTFLTANVAGHFKGHDPSVPIDHLKPLGSRVRPFSTFGKASGGREGRRGLRKRLDEYRRHGTGERVGHWGGRYIWQLDASAALLVGWKATRRWILRTSRANSSLTSPPSTETSRSPTVRSVAGHVAKDRPTRQLLCRHGVKRGHSRELAIHCGRFQPRDELSSVGPPLHYRDADN